MAKIRAGVLISGRGSNLKALIAAAADPRYPAAVVLVVSNRADAQGLAFAKAHGIATEVIDHRRFANRDAFDQALDAVLVAHGVELVACAGFMRILGADFAARWKGRLLNIHPSLLPAYPGLDTHERALADGATEHGCTVHELTAELDAGPIVLQAPVPVLPGDTPDTLAARVLAEEHRIYPEALARVARGLQAKKST